MRRAPQLGQKPRHSPKAPTVGATEGDQLLGVTAVTLHAQKSMFVSATLEIRLELPMHGQAENSKLLLVIHTYLEISSNAANVRMISARPATTHEQRQYEAER